MGILFGRFAPWFKPDKRLVRLFWCFFLVCTAMGICGVFANLFLMITSGNDLTAAFINNIFLATLMGITFCVMAWVSKKAGMLLPMYIGIASFILALSLLLILRENAPRFAILIGSLQGVGMGSFFTGCNALFVCYTTPGTRGYVFANQQMVYATAIFGTPLLASVVISLVSGLLGYMVVFALVIAGLLVTGILIRQFDDIVTHSKTGYGELLKRFIDCIEWRCMFIADIFRGMRDGFLFFNAILIFMISGLEIYVGISSFLTNFVAILFGMVLAKRIKADNHGKMLLFGVIMGICAPIILFFNASVATIMLYAIVGAFANITFGTVATTISSNTFDLVSDKGRLLLECVALRDVAINIGRALGVIPAFFVAHGDLVGYVWVILLLNIFQFGTWLFYDIADKHLRNNALAIENI